MSRNLVMCFDGTWKSVEARRPSNVVLTRFSAVGIPGQKVYYDAGVGTEKWDRIRGGVFGFGLVKNVEEAYCWLCRNYRQGDEIFLLGFSRGAYTARSVAGLIGICGIPRRSGTPKAAAALASTAVKVYRGRQGGADWTNTHHPLWPRVRFLGVWDTVGSLGVPLYGLGAISAWWHRFHDVSLGRHIDAACHLVAIDERRRPFKPTLWESQSSGTKVEQVWFPGVHTDVGGGGKDCGLSDYALLFMWQRARRAGMLLDRKHDPVLRNTKDCPLGDSMTTLYRLLRPYRRRIGRLSERRSVVGEAIHEVAVDMTRRPGYDSGALVKAAVASGVPVVA